jgi:hypothetical protein
MGTTVNAFFLFFLRHESTLVDVSCIIEDVPDENSYNEALYSAKPSRLFEFYKC